MSVGKDFIFNTFITGFEEKIKDKKPLNEIIKLPSPETSGGDSIWDCLRKRRSHRDYKGESVTLKELSQVLWGAYGVTAKGWGYYLKTAPSAGALYPIEIYVASFNVDGLRNGIYNFNPVDMTLKGIFEGNFSREITYACLDQDFILNSSFVLILTAIPSRTTSRYRERGVRYIFMDLGCIIQNIYISLTALNMGGCVIGAFSDSAMNKIMNLNPEKELVLALFSAGKI
ncbi:MAG: SagB/ThcOx family dehydrogenase [Candidatus Aminicenantia bacterium]